MASFAKMATKWEFLQPWCSTLGPYLSLQATPASERDDVVIVVRVGRFIGTEAEEIDQRFVQLQEALLVLVSALEVATSTDRTEILRLCGLLATLESVKTVRDVRFRLDFDVGSQGDHPHSLRILQALLLSKPYSAAQVQDAQSKILARGTTAPCPSDGFSISLRPPAKTMSTISSSFTTAPSRSETLDYYNALETLVDSLHKPSDGWIKVHSLDLDLTELETPPEAITSLGKIVQAPVLIDRLAMQLAYTWDFFDHGKIVKLLNDSKAGTVKHLQILATTRENYVAAMESLPQLINCRHVELDDRVLFGEMPPSFMSAFRRVFLSSKGWPGHWTTKKLTLRGLPFDEQSNRPTQYSPQEDSGLRRLAVYLASVDVPAFIQYLPVFGHRLEELEVYVTDRRNSEISLQHIASACPSLRQLRIDGTLVTDFNEIISPRRETVVAWSSLNLTNVTLPHQQDIAALAQALQHPNTGLARVLKEFVFVSAAKLPLEVVGGFEQALTTNKRLQRLMLGHLESIGECKLLEFHDEQLRSHRHAFLSLLTPLDGAKPSARSRIDTWNLRHIMELAELCPRREVILL